MNDEQLTELINSVKRIEIALIGDEDMGQMGLVEKDYAWITARLKEVAQRHAKGRIVSCLEGGYDLNALARSVEAHIRVLADI